MKQIYLKNIQSKLRNKFLKKGVKMIAPETVFFSKNTKIGKNVTIEPYVVISDKVSIGNNVKILSFSHLEGVKIENNVKIWIYLTIKPPRFTYSLKLRMLGSCHARSEVLAT